MLEKRIISVDDNILKINYDVLFKTKVDPQKIIALYSKLNGNINVGYPAKGAYRPIEGNMWGYEKADVKGLYMIVDDNYVNPFIDIYKVQIDEDRKIVLNMSLDSKALIKEETVESKEETEEIIEEEKEETNNSNIIQFDALLQKRRVLR